MRTTILATLVAVMLAGAIAGCADGGPGPGEAVASGAPAAGDTDGPVDASLSSAIAEFGFRLLGETAGEESHGRNTLLSPLSLHAALAMTYNGAAGATADEMESVLGISELGRDAANGSYANLLASLDALGEDGPGTLDVENSLWVDDSFPLLKGFAETDREYFGAQLETLDLPGEGAGRINEWVAGRTNGRITDLIDEVPDQAVLYLVNAVYLKAVWETPFPAEETSERQFSVGWDYVDVPTMTRAGEMLYAERDGTQAVRLPYSDGRLGMWVVLPAPVRGDPSGGVDLVLAGLNSAGWSELTGTATTRRGTLSLPKFTTRTKTELSGPLAGMGMPGAFEPETADFSGMYAGPDPLYISRVLHQTYVSVDESGTEAAAATGVEMTLGASIEMPGEEPFEMIVDRPFLFAIDDSRTGTMLFLGRIEDPR